MSRDELTRYTLRLSSFNTKLSFESNFSSENGAKISLIELRGTGIEEATYHHQRVPTLCNWIENEKMKTKTQREIGWEAKKTF